MTSEARMKEIAEAVWEREKEKELKKIILELSDLIPVTDDRATLQYWEPEMDLQLLFDTKMSEPETRLEVVRDKSTGEILRFAEVSVDEESTRNAQTSLSLKRAPAGPGLGIKGSSTNCPFLPGGMEEEYESAIKDLAEQTKVDLGFDRELLSIPPGFSKGMDFRKEKIASERPVDGDKKELNCFHSESADVEAGETDDFLALMDLIGQPEADEVTDTERKAEDQEAVESDDFLTLMDVIGGGGGPEVEISPDSSGDEAEEKVESKKQLDISQEDQATLQKVLEAPVTLASVQQQSGKKHYPKSEYLYAEKLDSTKPVVEFERKVGTLAKKYPFPLDPFQQQAVLCLERGDSVFVAAHTSAGKTVVAEYAVALCKRHLTRAVYTSPIKALSNQKFREFKQSFDDVGLITGDLQLHPDAFCLIMTTEILRSTMEQVRGFDRQFSRWAGGPRERSAEVGGRAIARPETSSPPAKLVEEEEEEKRREEKREEKKRREENCLSLAEEETKPRNDLKSMLYNGSEVTRELEWVIFDEVHYINDIERGVVWEEVLIMLPSHINIIMLSATVPNPLEFADWVGHIKKRKIYVISTVKRPVPLEHYLYTGTDGKTRSNRFLLVDRDRNFLNQGYKAALDSKKVGKKGQSGPGTGSYRQTAGNPKSDKNTWITLIGHLESCDLLPTVAFTFSRKRCDENAAMLTTIDLTTAVEKREIHHFFSKCIQTLKGSDKRLPQVLQMQDLCKRGLAVHHSGILPIMKEVVELLFQRGFVKVLFATETFAMGVNMPARTVVFDSMRKHDGKQNRDLRAGEYVQMAGRAGRRGLDTTGTVILLCKQAEIPEASDLAKMMLGTPVKLQSQFRVTYAMLLNLLRVEQLRVEDMLQRSFAESSTMKKGTSRREELKSVEERLASAPKLECRACNEGGIQNYHQKAMNFIRLERSVWKKIFYLPGVAKMMDAGRVVIVSRGRSLRTVLAIILKSFSVEGGKRRLKILLPVRTVEFEEKNPEEEEELEKRLRLWDLAVDKNSLGSLEGDPGEHSVIEIPVENVVGLCGKTLKIQGNKLLEDWERRQQPRFRNSSPDRSVLLALKELNHLSDIWRRSEGAPLVEPWGKDIQSSDVGLLAEIQELKQLKAALTQFTCTHCLSFKEHFMQIQEVATLEESQRKLKYLLSPESLQTNAAYKDKLAVLKHLGYVDANNLVELKGKVACEISQHELLVTELVLENVFSPLNSAEIAAILSCMTCQFKTKDYQLNEHMTKLKGIVMKVVDKITAMQNQFGVIDYDLTEELQFGLMEVVYEWGRGVPFAQLMDLTEAQEGLIVRCIQRLDEMCKDVRNGARIVGDPSLQQKMEDTSQAIKRDIVFAASLYTTIT